MFEIKYYLFTVSGDVFKVCVYDITSVDNDS